VFSLLIESAMWAFRVLAHALPFDYRFPLPIWVYVLGGGAAVLASAPAAALAVTADPGAGWRSRDLYPKLRRLRLGRIGLAFTSILLVWGLAGGIGGRTAEAHEFFENPLTLLIWVDFWVGLGLVSAFVGNVWDFVSPLSAAARALDRALARAGIEPFHYPARLGQWPAAILLVWWSWAELIWGPAKEPGTLAAMTIAYFGGTMLGTALFGAETWLGNVELFTVFARTFSRFAPLELRPSSPDEWLDSPVEEREVRLRPYGAGLRSGQLPAGGSVFVLALLATVVFDGFSQTRKFAHLVGWIEDHVGWFHDHGRILATLLMLAIVVVFVAAFFAVCAAVERTRSGAREAVRRYAPTLIPIAAVYFAAHYFSYLLLAGQATLGALVDPLGKGWNPWGLGEYQIWLGITPAVAVWWIQVVLIVTGHLAAVFAAHRVALRTRGTVGALAAQVPLVGLMVGYTMAGLWVLAQQIQRV
jgi:hypothetical protein